MATESRLVRLLATYSTIAAGITLAGVLLVASVASDTEGGGGWGVLAVGVLTVGLALMIYSAVQWIRYLVNRSRA